jgi:cardiolipin synthase
VAVFNRFWPPWKKQGRLTIRNHRKLIILDGTTAFCGGMNLSEEFAGDDYGEWVFDDTMVRLEGPCVRDLADVFMRTWRETTGNELPLPPRSEPLEDGAPIEVLETDPRRSETKLRRAISAAISQAEEQCYLTSPYFTPPPWLQTALLDAADRGVDVRILTAGDTDMRIARAAARHYYGPLLDRGVRIYEHLDRVLHSKTLMIDGLFGLVGSYNMDRWTSRHVLDVSVTTISAGLAAALETEFFDNLERSREISAEAWHDRGPLTRLKQRAASTVISRL